MSRRDEKIGAMCELSPSATGEHREMGSNNISVRKYMGDRIPLSPPR
ncbi:MAG: hypothetical protein U9N54_01580 [candidate division Zixibacteria bacterium]|nr:hypothetical protein [candidate division Zixibacteria bacterium]